MTGVILINFGGPVPPKPGEGEPIEPFLRDILRDVLPRPLKPFAKIFARLRFPRTKRMYDAIGGASPVVEWTMRQAQALEYKLNTLAPATYKTYIAMKYGKPSINDAIASAKKEGCDKIYLLPLFPYPSKYTDFAVSRFCEFANLRIYEFANSPQYIHCMTNIIRTALTDWRDIPPPQVTLLFTAHSIPKRAAKSDPYVRQINESVSEIMRHFTGYNFRLAFQSAPFKLGWLGPDVKSALRHLTILPSYHLTNLLIVPLGFACENLETLYELDQIYLPYAKSLGINVKRAPALNDNPIFIDLLAELVLEKM